MSDIQPFKIDVPQAVLDDQKERLERTRWPDEAEGAGWAHGTDLAYMRKLVEYWKTGYDWRKHEKALNTLSHYRTTLDGLGLHFVHERGLQPDSTPLLLLHGWPDSLRQALRTWLGKRALRKKPSRHSTSWPPPFPGSGFRTPRPCPSRPWPINTPTRCRPSISPT